jgi:hypothetical protein
MIQSTHPSYGIILNMKSENPRIHIQEELLLAKQSRMEGNEGRARVCARRAAGAAVLDHLKSQGKTIHSQNVYQILQFFRSSEGLPDRVKRALDHLVQRVDIDHQFPSEVDLINEANVLINYLNLGEVVQ